jgi:hypothetical protein
MDNDEDNTILQTLIDQQVDEWTSNVDATMQQFADLALAGGEVWSLTDGKDTFINVKAVNQIALLQRDNCAKAMAAGDYRAADQFAEMAYILQALVKTALNEA